MVVKEDLGFHFLIYHFLVLDFIPLNYILKIGNTSTSGQKSVGEVTH